MMDLAIIGGGPAGYVAAERAGAAGLQVTLFEREELGGVCLNEGCIPTKTLLYGAKMYDHALHGSKYGVEASEVKADYAKMVGRKNKVVRKLVLGIASKMKGYGVEVVKGTATVVSASEDKVVVACGETLYEAKDLLIATGSHTAIPPIPGLSEAGESVVTNREILAKKEVPSKLVVIGGGVIGMEFAGLYCTLGSEVTVIEMLPEILGGMDREVSEMVRAIYTKRGIHFYLNSKVTRIDPNKVTYEVDGISQTVESDLILLSVGRRASTSDLGLEKVGVALSRGAVVTDSRMRTNIPHIYAAGDVNGCSMLAHTASREAEVVVNQLIGLEDEMHYNAIPGVVYTNPEVASVGLSEEVAVAKGISFKVVKLPMTFSGRFVAENEGETGLCKLLLKSEDNTVLGMHLVGNPAGEMIYGGVMAIERGFTAQDLQRTVFPHPTVSEIIKETAFAE